MRSMQWQLGILGIISAFACRYREIFHLSAFGCVGRIIRVAGIKNAYRILQRNLVVYQVDGFFLQGLTLRHWLIRSQRFEAFQGPHLQGLKSPFLASASCPRITDFSAIYLREPQTLNVVIGYRLVKTSEKGVCLRNYNILFYLT